MDSRLKDLLSLATTPQLYQDFVATEAHVSLLNILTHENGDIIADAILVLKELIDTDSSDDDTIGYIGYLSNELIKNNCIEHLYNAISRLDEEISEEKQAVFNALGFFENLTEILTEETCAIIAQKTNFIEWLLKRLTWKDFDDVKHYASEIISILAQNSPEIQSQIGKLQGINTLLSVLSKYRKENPSSMEEEELVENIFNVLCVVCVTAENRPRFFECEGLELMRILIKSKKYCRNGALKLTNYILSNDPDACSKWLDIGGLGTLFTAFMKRVSKKSKRVQENGDEEHIMSIIFALVNSFRSPDYLILKQRLLQKFKENRFEKLERLVELHEAYATNVRSADTKRAQEDSSEDKSDEEKELIYLDRLESGLFTLQCIDYTLAFVCKEDEDIYKQASKILHLNNLEWMEVILNLAEFATHLSLNNEDEDKLEEERMYINSLIEYLEAQK